MIGPVEIAAVEAFAKVLIELEPAVEALVRRAVESYKARDAVLGPPPPEDGEAKVNAEVDQEDVYAR